MKNTYIYPAIFDFADDGISVEFPDLPGCYTCGDTIEEAMYMAQDAMKGFLACMEADNDDIPDPTDIRQVKAASNQIVQLVSAFMPPARKNYIDQTIRRNITLSRWMDDCVRRDHLNLSAFVQDALKAKYGY